MNQWVRTVADVGATAFGALASPALRFVARHRTSLRRFQSLSDRLGFQIRSVHYYEPTYRNADLPAPGQRQRSLPGLDLNEAAQLELLAQFRFADELEAIPLESDDELVFHYRNGMYSFGDAEILYNMIRLKKPSCLIEVGAGNSTLMARLAIAANKAEDPGYRCRHVCIEPYEMPWLEKVDVEVIRGTVESIDLAVFDALGENDILFIDSSHVIRPRGDVLREFHEIIPRLNPGVIVQVHDIFTPRDYPERWLREERRLWNEQYLLESFLAFNEAFEVICAANWLKHEHPDAFLLACPMVRHFPNKEPGAFWFRRKPSRPAA